MNSSALNQIEKILKDILSRMATKDDLKQFATKDDLKQFATKKDLEKLVTKDDLKKELSNFATKKDLKNGLEDLLAHIVSATYISKVEKRAFETLEKRVDKIEERLQVSPI